MIIDNIKNISLYKGLGNRIAFALKYLKESDFTKMEDGRYEVEGENIFALVSRYETKAPGKGVWESHRKYIDVQFIAAGAESIGYSNPESTRVIKEHDEEKDIQFMEGSGNFATARANTFVILFPDDVHMPGIQINGPEKVLKVVVKVRIY